LVGERTASDRRRALKVAREVALEVKAATAETNEIKRALDALIKSRQMQISASDAAFIDQLGEYKAELDVSRLALEIRRKSFASVSGYEKALKEKGIKNKRLTRENTAYLQAIDTLSNSISIHSQSYIKLALSFSSCVIDAQDEQEDYTTIPVPSCGAT